MKNGGPLHPCLLVWFAAVTVIAGACGEVKPSEIEAHAESAVIVIPGYYGTRLAEVSTGRLVWLSAREAFFGTTSLALPLEGLGIHDSVALKPDGILDDIPVIPLIYSLDGYGTLIKELDRRLGPRTMVVPLAYDWREELPATVVELHRTLERVRAQGAKRIALVAHSMGGLIASYYLRYGAQQPDQALEKWDGIQHVDAVVLAGVPYRGSMTTFRNMQYGRSIAFNKTMLTSEAVSSFPASYFVLPAPGTDVLLSPALEKLDGLLYQPGRWKEYGWGLLRDGTGRSEAVTATRAAYTEQWLAQAARFFALLHRPAQGTGQARIPLLAVTGTGFETLASGFWLGPDSSVATGLLFDRDQVRRFRAESDHSLLLSDGDGTVTVGSSSLPPAYQAAFAVQHRTWRVSHRSLVTDSGPLEEMTAFLASALAPP